jgi:hypothetical protein
MSARALDKGADRRDGISSSLVPRRLTPLSSRLDLQARAIFSQRAAPPCERHVRRFNVADRTATLTGCRSDLRQISSRTPGSLACTGGDRAPHPIIEALSSDVMHQQKRPLDLRLVRWTARRLFGQRFQGRPKGNLGTFVVDHERQVRPAPRRGVHPLKDKKRISV